MTKSLKKIQEFLLHPIGEIFRKEGRTYLKIDEKYQDGLLGIENYPEIMIVYWFDQNDDPAQRAILQVHPGNNPENPIRGVFTTRSPVRPNLIGISETRILKMEDLIIEIEDIDARDHSPLLDIKKVKKNLPES
jgi:tRNA-Thr(GGU) m(6)t(6)A37 methyltransferase TsaA